MILQLKPAEESFYEIIFSKLRKLDVILLCEGKKEVKIVKELIKKLGIVIDYNLGITDCEGIASVNPVLVAMVSLTISRRLKCLAVLIDAEEMSPEQRVHSILNGLKAREFRVEDPQFIESNVFISKIYGEEREFSLIISVSGIMSLNLKTHSIDDHLLVLLQNQGIVSEDEVTRIKKAKEITEKFSTIELIKASDNDLLENVFKHVVVLIKEITKIVK